MNDKLVAIGEAAELLGVSIDTLRRWDNDGSFPSIKSPKGHRYYSRVQIELYRNDLFSLAEKWAMGNSLATPTSDFYCESQTVFQSRLTKMERLFENESEILPWFSLIVAATGEIGNNSFDHNIGNWPDVLGIFYGYDLKKKIVVLADRGRGVLTTLRQVRPGLKNDTEALHTAFTEVVSGRAPEARGNGLKYVKSIIDAYPLSLEFRSGNAIASIESKGELVIRETDQYVRGCVAKISYSLV